MTRHHKIRHTHASGRFDRSAFTLHVSLVFFALMSNVITLTEVVGRDRLHAVFKLRRFAFYKHPKSDAAVLWKQRRFRPMIYRGLHVGKTGSGPRRNIWASAVALKDKRTKLVHVVSSLHMVADVESDVYKTLNGDPEERATDYHAMFVEWIAQSIELAQDAEADYLILSTDSNLNYHRTWVQNYIGDLLSGSGLRVTWNADMPDRGTHGKRLIDLAIASRSLRVVSIRVLGRKKVRKASDHLAFTEVLKPR